MIRILVFAVVGYGLGYLYGSNEILRIKTIDLLKKVYEVVVDLIKKLIAKIKGE